MIRLFLFILGSLIVFTSQAARASDLSCVVINDTWGTPQKVELEVTTKIDHRNTVSFQKAHGQIVLEAELHERSIGTSPQQKIYRLYLMLMLFDKEGKLAIAQTAYGLVSDADSELDELEISFHMPTPVEIHGMATHNINVTCKITPDKRAVTAPGPRQ